jgi:hypothetical protein
MKTTPAITTLKFSSVETVKGMQQADQFYANGYGSYVLTEKGGKFHHDVAQGSLKGFDILTEHKLSKGNLNEEELQALMTETAKL